MRCEQGRQLYAAARLNYINIGEGSAINKAIACLAVAFIGYACCVVAGREDDRTR